MADGSLAERLNKLLEIAIALSAERELDVLMEKILMGSKALTNADGGTLYTVTEDKKLRFQIVRTDSLGFKWGGSAGQSMPFPDIPLYDKEGRPNDKTVVAHTVLHDKTVNIPDAYASNGFDFSGTRKFDKQTGYHSQSFLAVPLKNHEGEIIGVLQLINAQDPTTKEVRPFSVEDQRLLEALASQAAVAMTNQSLILGLKEMFESLIRVLADAIDQKSPYTGGHCRRVPILAHCIAEGVNRHHGAPYQDIDFSEEELYELDIAALLHDCGKVVTPVHVQDKGTKLETIYDRIHEIDERIEGLKRAAEIDMLRGKLEDASPQAHEALQKAYEEILEALDADKDFLHRINVGGESMGDADLERLQKLSQKQYSTAAGESRSFLSEDEVKNLSILKGTLTDEERDIINEHIVVTIDMLKKIPYPKHLSNVVEIAGGHHERIDGKGYPYGLTGDQMSVRAKILVIADIFEALTAPDRPYKKAMPLSKALEILGTLAKSGHVDPALYQVFVDEKVYLDYARGYLKPEQIDID